MVREEQPRDREKAGWRSQVRFWSVAVISIALLSACFIVSCVVTYHLTYGKTGQRLSELHTRHSGLTCFSEGTSMRENVWACCPCAWKSFGSSCYFISTEQNFWSKSEQNCVAMGAHLVVINTEAEQILNGVSTFNHTINKHFDLFGEMAIIWKNFLVQQLNESLSYFLGLSDTQGNDNWQWIDQTPYKENVRLWHQNEPNFSAEECASIVFWENRGWGWNDVFCDTKRNSICEMKKIYL